MSVVAASRTRKAMCSPMSMRSAPATRTFWRFSSRITAMKAGPRFFTRMSFFFQAEDGIRSHCVTGVQTCALPIWCWRSLFTERAVTYRQRRGIDHRTVHMAVVVQQMVFPQAAGILFTADPVTSNRRVASVEAGFGLGEALVSGLVNPDVFKVRDGEVVARAVGAKRCAV